MNEPEINCAARMTKQVEGSRDVGKYPKMKKNEHNHLQIHAYFHMARNIV